MTTPQNPSSGIAPDAWESIRRTRVLLKGPVATPQGGGMKSLNVTIRKTLGLYANVRPCSALHPFVPTRHPDMNVVIIRENEEDVYAGIEHRQTDDVVQCLKLISVPGSRRLMRYAFEYARQAGRRKVTCMTKDNIMKMTDGLFHRIFDEVGADYPDLEREHLIVDIGAARLATRPSVFDVVVLPNLYGDILSDVAAELAAEVEVDAGAGEGPPRRRGQRHVGEVLRPRPSADGMTAKKRSDRIHESGFLRRREQPRDPHADKQRGEQECDDREPESFRHACERRGFDLVVD